MLFVVATANHVRDTPSQSASVQRFLCFYPVEQRQLSKQRSFGKLPQHGASETGRGGCQGDCAQGFGLSRTGDPVETGSAAVVWQQSANTQLSRCIASRIEKHELIKCQPKKTQDLSCDFGSAEV